MSEAQKPPARDPVGKVLAGKYQIDSLLKRGGMGAVYRATHLMLHKPVAVKLIKPELVTSEDTVRRFHREAQAASQLDHPNIVTIHDLGKAEDGTLYIAMELVSGTSLKELVKTEGALEPARAVRIAKAIGNALALAHRNHIIHRDLKPQNIMICRDADGGEQPKLLDFGIAKTFESDGPALTSTGLVLGTPHYMSPEQAKGVGVDGRSDLYALGIILYEMLVGKVPFEAPSIPAILVKHLNEAPKPPTELRPGLDPSLEALVLRCLEKEPEKRYQTAPELTAALGEAESVLAMRATTATPSALPSRAPQAPNASTNRVTEPTVRAFAEPAQQEPARRSSGKRAVILVAAAVLLFLAVGGAALWGIGQFFSATPSAPPTGEAVAETVPRGSPAAAPVEPPSMPMSDEPQAKEISAGGEAPSTAPAQPEVVEPEPVNADTVASGTPATGQTSPQPESTVTAPPAEPAPSPAPAPIPANPSVEIYCEGLSDACAALRSELTSSLRRAGLPLAGADEPDVFVALYTEEIESRSEQQFGTTFVTRTYSMESSGRSPRFGDEALGMPPPEVFSFDTRFGRERLNERSRALAGAITRRIQEYWSRRRP